MSFRFDARAAFEQIRSGEGAVPTVPKPPTEAPPRGETVGRIGTVGRGRPQIAALAVDIAAFEERSAIAQFDGELPREEAETLAAREQGFDSADDLRREAVACWRREIDRLAELGADGAEGAEGAEALKRAQAFIREGWALQAVRFGWGEVELFGVSPEAPWRRLDGMGAAFGGGVQVVTEDAIVHLGGRRFYRATANREGAAPVWEALSG